MCVCGCASSGARPLEGACSSQIVCAHGVTDSTEQNAGVWVRNDTLLERV